MEMSDTIEGREPNNLLRQQRELRGWSRQKVATELSRLFPDVAVTEKEIGRWESGKRKPGPFYREKLCFLFNTTADKLGFIKPIEHSRPAPVVHLSPDNQIITLTGEEATYLSSILLGDDPMTKFDQSRRVMLLKLLGATGISFAVSPQELLNPEPWERLTLSGNKPQTIDKKSLDHFSKLTETCWHLVNASESVTVEGILPTYLPKIEQLALQPSANQKAAASIASQGYILAAEVDRENVTAMERYCDLAVQYSQTSGDYNIQVAALKQQATIALVAKKPDKALQIYQRTIPLVRFISPLLKARIYMGLASAYARCGYQKEAERYIGLAHDAFPSNPEGDPSFLYAVCSTPVLHLYDGLTYMDLDMPRNTWDALEHVNGLQPKMPIFESARIEIINLQASAAASLGDMERACTYVEAGAKAAANQGYDIWSSESADVYQQIRNNWPQEHRVKELAELFQR